MGDFLLQQGLSNGFSQMEGPFRAGIGQNQDELFSTVSGKEILGPVQTRMDRSGHGPQTIVSGLMTIGVIVQFEIIDVAEYH